MSSSILFRTASLVCFAIYNNSSNFCLATSTMSVYSPTTLTKWVSDTFLGGSMVTVDAVVRVLDHSLPLSSILSSLSESELVWILVYDIIENKKYNTGTLSKQQKLFIFQTQKGFDSIPFEIKDDVFELWEKSGCLKNNSSG
jgi:hypothetical protein